MSQPEPQDHRKPPKPPKKTGTGTAGFDDHSDDARPGVEFSKITRAIIVAVREGGEQTESNENLKMALDAAKRLHFPAQNIKNAIRKGKGEIPTTHFERITLEAYVPGGAAILLEGITDNAARTKAEIRSLLSKGNGTLAGAGSTKFMFLKKAVILVNPKDISMEALTECLDVEKIEDVQMTARGYQIIADPVHLPTIETALRSAKIAPLEAYVSFIPISTVDLNVGDAESLRHLIFALQAHDDVHHVYTNAEYSDGTAL